jgi:hypothetical protein
MMNIISRVRQNFKGANLLHVKDIRNESFLIPLTLVAIGVGVGVRLYLAYAFRGNYDQFSYELVAEIMNRGGNVYAETSRYNYSPLWAYVLAFLQYIADSSHVQFHFVIRSFLTMVDILVGIFIGLNCSRWGFSDARIGFSLYMLNPVALMLVGFHGQFENLAMLPLLIGTYLYARQPASPPWKWIWLLGTTSLLIKHITVFGVWMLFYSITTKRRAFMMFSFSVLFFWASFLPWLPEGGSGILTNVFKYQAVTAWGLARWFPVFLVAPLFYAFMISTPVLAKEYLGLSLARSMEFSGVALLALIFGIGKQYLILPVIFGSIFFSPWYGMYTLVGGCGIAVSYAVTHFSIVDKPLTSPLWNIVWLGAVCWLASYFIPKKNTILHDVKKMIKSVFAG